MGGSGIREKAQVSSRNIEYMNVEVRSDGGASRAALCAHSPVSTHRSIRQRKRFTVYGSRPKVPPVGGIHGSRTIHPSVTGESRTSRDQRLISHILQPVFLQDQGTRIVNHVGIPSSSLDHGQLTRKGAIMKFAVIVVDMHKDAFKGPADHPAMRGFRAIIPEIRHLVAESRALGGLIVYTLDSYLADDFLFTGKMKPHAVRGTEGEQLIDELELKPGDMVLPKRRFSAFFRTDLDLTLRTLHIDTIAVCGLTTDICVLATAMDGLCNDFSTAIIADCCAARRPEDHEAIKSVYSHFPTYPTLRVRTMEEFLSEAREGRIR